jgi:hypothetical protein
MNLFRKSLNYQIILKSGKTIKATGKMTLLEKIILVEGQENYLVPLDNVEYVKKKLNTLLNILLRNIIDDLVNFSRIGLSEINGKYSK